MLEELPRPLRSGMYTRVHCKPEESIHRAILLTARRALIEQQTHLKNTVRGLLKSYGIWMGDGKKGSFFGNTKCRNMREGKGNGRKSFRARKSSAKR